VSWLADLDWNCLMAGIMLGIFLGGLIALIILDEAFYIYQMDCVNTTVEQYLWN